MHWRRWRKTKRETLQANLAAERFYAAGVSDADPRRSANEQRLAEFAASIPQKRVRRSAVDIDAVHRKRDLERYTIALVAELLATFPDVLFAVRANSGSMAYESQGRAIPVFFYKLVRVPCEMTITDFWGLLRSGVPFAIECKRPLWRPAQSGPDADRERRQRAFIEMIEAIGGRGGFARSVDDAYQILAGSA